MILYKPTDWLKALFLFHKSDTFRKLLPYLIVMAVLTFGIAYYEINYLKASEEKFLKNITVMHSLLGFAISMLLVFRTNTAYDRWWEGRKQWGNLINCSRNVAVKLKAVLPLTDQKNIIFFKTLIPTFANELVTHLRQEKTRLLLDEKPHPEIPNYNDGVHIPNQIAYLLIQKTNTLYKAGSIDGFQFQTIITEFENLLQICGACERIKNTPIPYTYSSFIKKFIFIYVITLPLGFVFSLGYYTIPVVVFIFYVLASLELIAEEIEEPFGNDENDLPMQRIAKAIQKNVEEIFEN